MDDKDFLTLMPKFPKHVGIIMDGNNRWAKKNNKSLENAYRAGLERIATIAECCKKYNICTLSLFAFSSENWKRAPSEIRIIMKLFSYALKEKVPLLHEKGICFKMIGDRSQFVQDIQLGISEAENLTKKNKEGTLLLAASYGGRWDIIQAIQKISQKVKEGLYTPEKINEKLFQTYLMTSGFSFPDLLIRTSGEYRLSNFMLWQCAYSEFYFTETLWPDFDDREFYRALSSYASRTRRFGQ